jgi:hypothetical protein
VPKAREQEHLRAPALVPVRLRVKGQEHRKAMAPEQRAAPAARAAEPEGPEGPEQPAGAAEAEGVERQRIHPRQGPKS